MRGKRNAHRILVGKLEGDRPLGRLDMDWIDLAQDRGYCKSVVNMVMSLQVP
jgi:hypothetical protein